MSPQKDDGGIKIAVKFNDKNPFLGVYKPQEPLIIFIDVSEWNFLCVVG